MTKTTAPNPDPTDIRMDTYAVDCGDPAQAPASESLIVGTHNPIIGDVCGDTLYNASCAVAFLARYHNAQADAGFQCESIVVPLAGHESRGLAVLCECIEAALNYEMGRVANG